VSENVFVSKISKPTKLDCKQNFYCTVYYITLNSNCDAQRASKNLKKIVELEVKNNILNLTFCTNVSPSKT
jgi:hypothetical protein